MTLSDGAKVYAPTAPSSGVLVMFMLNILDGKLEDPIVI